MRELALAHTYAYTHRHPYTAFKTGERKENEKEKIEKKINEEKGGGGLRGEFIWVCTVEKFKLFC